MLASQCTTVIFIQRITVLKSIESCWAKGFETNTVTPQEHDAAAENGLNSLIKVNDGGTRIKLEPEYSDPCLKNLAVDGGDSSDGTIVEEHMIGSIELIEEEDRGKLNAPTNGEEEELGAKRSKGAVVRGRPRAKRKKTAIRKGKTNLTKKEPKDIEEPAEECGEKHLKFSIFFVKELKYIYSSLILMRETEVHCVKKKWNPLTNCNNCLKPALI